MKSLLLGGRMKSVILRKSLTSSTRKGQKNILNSSFALNGSLNKKGLIPFH